MTANWSDARRHMVRVLKCFFAFAIAGTIVGMICNEWWLASIWLTAGCVAGVIGASASRRGSDYPHARG
jgi:hypothetical protein